MRIDDRRRHLARMTETLDQLKNQDGVTYQDIDDELDKASFEEFCKQLDFLSKSKDPKSIALFRLFKKGWKNEFSKIKVTREFIGIRDLHPTQNEIFAYKSLAPMLNGKWKVAGQNAVKLVLSAKGVKIPMDPSANPPSDPIVVCEVDNVMYLIDGHHRWSKFYAFNPTCQLDAYVIHGSFESADDVLKFAQGTLVAAGGSAINPQKGGDINMYDSGTFDYETLSKIVDENLTDEVMEIIKAAPLTANARVENKDELIRYLWHNISVTMYSAAPIGDHARQYMPQFPEGDTNPANAVDRIAAESIRKRVNENTKVTLTIGQIKRLIMESRKQ